MGRPFQQSYADNMRFVSDCGGKALILAEIVDIIRGRRADEVKIHVNQGEIEVVAGDITLQETAAIVNAANNHLWMGGGVAGAIKRAGGSAIETEAISLGPVEVGEAVL